ncbi:hypothetical protein DPMN_178527 [Dreissena polymorpha]|uniref:Uncharacterized protein n=1 Tax=Dreissena polymorpha TaxID=45954 RepID=A0A9D4EF82_DREPO|nr:hypothetical protein DPMN_178527 [Dreissena polymorpha]
MWFDVWLLSRSASDFRPFFYALWLAASAPVAARDADANDDDDEYQAADTGMDYG